MIRTTFDVNGYWKVIIYFNVDYNLFNFIVIELKHYKISTKTIKRVYENMVSKKAKAVTISANNYHTSIVLFNTHKTKYDYINSIVHEAEHIKQSMLESYNVKDSGEPPAYTIGFLVANMLRKFYTSF